MSTTMGGKTVAGIYLALIVEHSCGKLEHPGEFKKTVQVLIFKSYVDVQSCSS